MTDRVFAAAMAGLLSGMAGCSSLNYQDPIRAEHVNMSVEDSAPKTANRRRSPEKTVAKSEDRPDDAESLFGDPAEDEEPTKYLPPD